MTGAVPLILIEEPVTWRTWSKVSKPHIAVVYADAAAKPIYPREPLNRSQRRKCGPGTRSISAITAVPRNWTTPPCPRAGTPTSFAAWWTSDSA